MKLQQSEQSNKLNSLCKGCVKIHWVHERLKMDPKHQLQ